MTKAAEPNTSANSVYHFDDHAIAIAKRQYMQPGDNDVYGMFRRIANWVAGGEKTDELRAKWSESFYDLMASKRFCPGGRVLAGAGTQHGNVLNCFVQGATANDPSSFEGVMEVARKLALVTKVGGGNGVNLDVYAPRSVSNRRDNAVRGWAYMSVSHPDVEDFIKGLMRPPTMPDGEKTPTTIRNWTKVIYGVVSPELSMMARQYGVAVVLEQPENLFSVPDDMGGIIEAARTVCENAKMGLEPRIDLSAMRHEGAAIKGSGGTSSGPVSFLFEIFDNFLEWANLGAEQSGPVATLRYCYAPVLRVVRQGGTRRGAGMATISIDHPDVLDFLTAKDLDRESAEGDISTFNISILATEHFWNVLQDDGLWEIQPLEVPAKYHVVTIDDDYTGRWPDLQARALDGAKAVPLYNTPTGQVGVPATWIWRQIAEHAWSTGEPGLIFNDRVNEMSALKNLGPKYEIKSTNPCVTGDTMIAVADGRGAVSFRELTEAGVDVPVYAMDYKGRPAVRWMRNPRVTGYKQAVYQITFDDGLKVRVTGNHKFNLTDGTYREALELQPGDSVASMTRFHGNFDDALNLHRKRSQDYVWLTNGKGQPTSEHRLIAAFHEGRRLMGGEVVHHRDHNGLNNRADNLEVMSREAHEALHRDDMLEDNNPMRERWWGQLSDAEKDAYRVRMAVSTGGERNGRFSGVSHDQILEAARDLAQTLGRGFTRPEWHAHAAVKGLPQSLSSYRKEELGSVQDLSGRVAAELGLPIAPRGLGRSRHFARNLQLFKSALESGYVSARHDGDFYPIVTRSCECCGTHYEMSWDRREVSFCRPCGLKKASEMGRAGAQAAMRRISENTVERQVRAYNDLKFTLGRRPWKTEWEKHCKDAGVPVRLHNGGVPTYTELEQRASVANHRVVSVEFDGYEDVYNGTVDEFHNYYIGHHKLNSDGNKPRFSYVNTRNCGEIPLTVGEPCDLGAINLATYVNGSSFDFKMFRKDVRDCIRFLDDVLEVNVFALEDNKVASHNLRRLGLGVMGLADALIKLGLRYDRQDGRDMIDEIMTVMREESILESEALGVERGVYPVYAENTARMPHRPRRNVAVLTVAPTGTTSMLMGVSSGIEPVFSPFIWRKIGADYKALIAPLFQELLEQFPAHPQYAREGRWDWDKVTDALSGNHGSCVGLEFVPEVVQSVFVCAHDIEPLDHVRMQGTVQRAFDAEGYAANSLSKTINLPNEATVEEIEDAYSEAYRTGCKGITVYRDGSRQFQVLSVSKDEKKEEKLEIEASTSSEHSTNHDNWHVAPGFQPGKPIMERPARLTGVTDMVKLTDLAAGTKRTFLITTNTHEGTPVEIVVVSGRAGDEANADSEALGRIVSIALQYGVPVEAIQKTLRGINGGLYGSYNGRLVASKADLIAVALESTAAGGKVVPAEQALLYPVLEGAAPSASELDTQSDVPLFKNLAKVEMKGERCPSCSSNNMIREEGCLKCLSCGYSKCG